jgi:hypothetical protein
MAEYDRSATGPLPVDAGPRRAESIFDMSPEDFRASLGEMQAMGHDTDALMRQYRARNSIFAPINNAAEAQAQGLADSGRRSVLGGLLSKPEGATGLDAIMGLEREGWRGLLGAGQQVGQAFDAPAAAAQGLIPQSDVNMEALNTAGLAMGAGGAVTAPSGALRLGLAREGLSEAQRQARDILDMRAAGNARSVTDDMMARADDQYMFDNTPLPMDAQSRAARADAGGFDTGTQLFHGARQPFEAFIPSEDGFTGPGVYTTPRAEDASDYALDWGVQGQNVMPLRGKADGFVDAKDFRDAISETYNSPGYGEYPQARQATARRLADEGATGVDLINYGETSDGYGPYVAQRSFFDPTNIRSRFARFDPEFSHLSNLSAANASPTAGLLAMQQEQDKPLPFMEMLRGLLR